jgi:hypothetical protein
MLYQTDPHTGEWFRAANGDAFEVLDVDTNNHSIEIQHFDGTLEEIDTEAWHSMYAEPIAPPEDYYGSLDIPDEDRVDWDSAVVFNRASPLDLMD